MQWFVLIVLVLLASSDFVWMSLTCSCSHTLRQCHEECFALFHQISMNVRVSLLVMEMLPAPTHLDPSHVRAMQDTVEMEWRAEVSVCTQKSLHRCSVFYHNTMTVWI